MVDAFTRIYTGRLSRGGTGHRSASPTSSAFAARAPGWPVSVSSRAPAAAGSATDSLALDLASEAGADEMVLEVIVESPPAIAPPR
jgi:hypothetical protein